MKILFITANRVGDAVLTTGLLAYLTSHYPTARFTIACGPYGADLFRAVPRLDRLIIVRKRKLNRHWLLLWQQCINTRWDLIIDLRNSIVSRLLWTSQHAHYRRSSGQHKVIDNADVLKLTPPPAPHIWITAEATRQAETMIPAHSAILALGPAANWPAKQWPVAHFIALVNRLTAPGEALEGAPVMIIADQHEREQIMPLLNAIPASRRLEIIGHDLQTVAACLKHARLYVGNDSGLMHLAAALEIPTLGLFGPGYPSIYRPWGKRCAFITTPESRDELLARLKENVHANLMQSLSVDRVLSAAKALLVQTS